MTRLSRSVRAAIAAFAVAVAGTGCVVAPVQVYIAEAGAGTPVFERCSLTPDLPVGVRVQRHGLQAVVSIDAGPPALVPVQFDIPEGVTVVLRETTVRVDARDGTPAQRAPIPHVNPAAPARHPETPAIQKLVLPTDTPLHGGRVRIANASFDKHYWIAAPLQAGLSKDDVWVTLPEVAIDGVATQFDEIHFKRHRALGHALFNC